MERSELLRHLVAFDLPLESTLLELQAFSWDVEIPLLELQTDSIRSVLKRYLAGEINADQVEKWADAIECRDDIDTNAFQTILCTLSNPIVFGDLTKSSAEALLHQIEGY